MSHPPIKHPFISVIVPTFQDSDALEICLQALIQQNYARDRHEIIVINNDPAGSLSPAVHALAKQYPHIQLQSEWKRGSYAARNRGIQVSKGSILAFTDADCIPAPDWLSSGVEAFRQYQPNCDLVAGSIEITIPELKDCTAFEVYEFMQAFNQKQYVNRDRYAATANLFVHREVFNSVGRFNEELQSGGDFEWGRRATRHGYSLIYANHVRISHPARKSLSEMTSKTRRIIKGHFTLMRKKLYPSSRFIFAIFADLLFPYRSIPHIMASKKIDNRRIKSKAAFASVLIRYIRAFYRVRIALAYPINTVRLIFQSS